MAKQRRRRGTSNSGNGTFRVHVYAGLDPITKKPRYLNSADLQAYQLRRQSQPALIAT